MEDMKKDLGRLAASPKMNSAEDHLSMPMLSAHSPAIPEQQTNP